MPEILPFRGVRYDPARVDLASVIAPPYDVISKEQQLRLYESHPQNVVRLILGREENRYTSAAGFFVEWMKAGILLRDRQPAFYLLHQTFADKNGNQRTRKGFIALCRISDYDERIVIPHEQTLPKHLEDRLNLLTATRVNFSQIFSLYADNERSADHAFQQATSKPVVSDVTFEGVRNQLWCMDDPGSINEVRKLMDGRQVLIADGHHRYQTALKYRDQCRSQNPQHTGKEPYNFVMMFFTNMEDEGLVIYPTHRVIHSLPGFDGFDIRRRLAERLNLKACDSDSSMIAALRETRGGSFGCVLRDDPNAYLLTVKEPAAGKTATRDTVPSPVADLDVTVLHEDILKSLLGLSPESQASGDHVTFVKEEEASIDAVRSGRSHIAFLMNATSIDQIQRVTRAGFQMPQKSTYFYPKLVSGLVLNQLED